MGMFGDLLGRSAATGHAPAAPMSAPAASAGSGDFVPLHHATDEEVAAAWPAAIARYGLQANPDGTPVIDSSLIPKGEKRWEDAYRQTLAHDISGERIYGHPGSGLSESGFGQDQVRSGSRGEEVFAKLLSWDGVLDRCVSFWSVWNPQKDGSRNTYGTDIDCILKFGSHIFLVDVKNYRAGLDYHTLIPGQAMFCMYPVARVVAQQPYVFSCNMGFAQQNVTAYLRSIGSQCTVESYVVLVPGRVGEAELDGDIHWPGGIEAMSYSSFVAMIQQRFGEDPSYASLERTPEEGWLASLVKLYEHQETLLGDTASDQSAWPRPTCDRQAGIAYPNPRKNPGKKGSRSYGRAQSAKGNAGHGKRYDGPRSGAPRNPEQPASTMAPSASSSASSQAASGKPAAAPSSGPRGSRPAPASDRPRQGKHNPIYLTEVPPVNPADMSIMLGRAGDGDVPVSFERVSCMTIAGVNRSGEVGRTFTLATALERSADVNLRVIDCKRSSQFSALQERAHSYVRMGDGLDLVEGELQGAYTSMNARLRRLRKAGVDGFWSQPDHAGLPLEVVLVHACEELLGREWEANEDDQSYLASIRRYLGKLIDGGVRAGCCVVLSSQKPSKKAFPEDLVKDAQVRILYQIGVDGQAKAFLAGVDGKVAGEMTHAALAFDKPGKACMVAHGRLTPKIMFKTLDSGLLDREYPF